MITLTRIVMKFIIMPLYNLASTYPQCFSLFYIFVSLSIMFIYLLMRAQISKISIKKRNLVELYLNTTKILTKQQKAFRSTKWHLTIYIILVIIMITIMMNKWLNLPKTCKCCLLKVCTKVLTNFRSFKLILKSDSRDKGLLM